MIVERAERTARTAATAAVCLLAAALLMAGSAAPARAEEASETSWPVLTAAKATSLIRSALRSQFGEAWTGARGHALDCSTAVHPQRGGATQETEIRRRCKFSWSYGKTRYSGSGLVWLGGARPDGSRHWAVQYHGVERTGKRTKRFYQVGQLLSAG